MGEETEQRSLTFGVGQTDRADKVGDGNSVVQSQDRNVFVKVGEAKVLNEGSENESGLGAVALAAAVVLAKCHSDHKPEEAERSKTTYIIGDNVWMTLYIRH